MMITGRIRAVGVFVRALLAPRATVSRLPMAVRVTDIDLNLHLTNSRYPQLMDLGRLDLLVRSGAGRALHQQGLGTVLVESTIAFKRDLPLGARFTLETRVVGRDRKAIVFEQRFLVGDRVHALGVAKMVLTRDHKVIEPTVLDDLIPRSDDQVQGSERLTVQ